MNQFKEPAYYWNLSVQCKGKKNRASYIILLMTITIVLFLASGFLLERPVAAEASFEVYDDFARSDFTRISVTADLHLETEINRTRMIQCLKAMEETQDPDVIIFCGDLYSGSPYTSPEQGVYEYGSGFSNAYDEVRAAVSFYNGNAVPVFIAGNHDMDIPGDYYLNSGYSSYYGLLPTLNFDIFLFGSSQPGTYVGLYTEDQINALNEYLAARPDKTKPVIVAGHFPIDQDQVWNATNSNLVIATMAAYDQPITFLWAHRHEVNPPPYYIEYDNYTVANAGAVSYNDPSYARELNLTLDRFNDLLDYEWFKIMTENGNKERSAYLHQVLTAFTPKLSLNYTAGANGMIAGEITQDINYSSDGIPVTAVPDIGYHFVNWSDGSTANPRTDSNVTKDISVTALFDIGSSTIPVNGVSFEATKIILRVGDQVVLTAKIDPVDASNQAVTWESSNTRVATVDAAGIVTPKKSGSAVITVTTEDGDYKATCSINVKNNKRIK